MIVTWAQLDVLNKYNFHSGERDTIIKILELKDKNLLDRKTLYDYGLYVCTLACELYGADKKELNQVYSKLPIHSKLDIALSPMLICNVLDKTPGAFLKKLISDLELAIIYDKVANTKEALTEYITNNYN